MLRCALLRACPFQTIAPFPMLPAAVCRSHREQEQVQLRAEQRRLWRESMQESGNLSLESGDETSSPEEQSESEEEFGCEVCRKNFRSEAALMNHNASKKHRKLASAQAAKNNTAKGKGATRKVGARARRPGTGADDSDDELLRQMLELDLQDQRARSGKQDSNAADAPRVTAASAAGMEDGSSEEEQPPKHLNKTQLRKWHRRQAWLKQQKKKKKPQEPSPSGQQQQPAAAAAASSQPQQQSPLGRSVAASWPPGRPQSPSGRHLAARRSINSEQR